MRRGFMRAFTRAVGALRRAAGASSERSRVRSSRRVSGADTIVATPSGWTALVRAGTPWLATAGSGDVLGGVLGAMIAGAAAGAALDAEALGPLAASGAWVHGRAGVVAAHAEAGPGHPIVALDVVGALPAVIQALLERRHETG